jgi:hypothetical protein
MLTLVKKRYEELSLLLNTLEEQYQVKNPPEDYTPLVLSALNEIADTLGTYTFSSDEEEIAFNRDGLASLLSLAIYESEKYRMLRILYYGTEAEFDRYCSLFFQRVADFFDRHAEFFTYCFSGRKDLDADYFLRSSETNRQITNLPAPFSDKNDFAAHSVLAAALVGYTRNCLDAEAFYLVPVQEASSASTKLQWTDSAVALVELIYALYFNGSFNHGQATLKEIAEYFERIYGVDLGDIYRVYQDTLYRKSGATAFLDRLRKTLGDHEN